MAMQRQPRLEAQGVSRAQAGRGGPGGDDGFPQGDGVGGGDEGLALERAFDEVDDVIGQRKLIAIG